MILEHIHTQGSFKYNCQFHKEQPINRDLYQKHKNGEIKRNIFKRLSGYKIYTIASCCIQEGIFDVLKDSCFYNENFGNIVTSKLKNFDKEIASRINFDRFCHGPLIQSFCDTATARNGYRNQL